MKEVAVLSWHVMVIPTIGLQNKNGMWSEEACTESTTCRPDAVPRNLLQRRYTPSEMADNADSASTLVQSISNNLGTVFRHLFPGVLIVGAAAVIHPSWFVDRLDTHSWQHLVIIAIIAPLGNVSHRNHGLPAIRKEF
jgi:hypothetical protein